MAVSARVVQGKLVVKGVGTLLQRLQERDHRLSNDGIANRYFTHAGHFDETDNDGNESYAQPDVAVALLDDDEGPNHKGTYSKAYTLRHPEVKWVHRGQGRYLPQAQQPRTSTLSKAAATPQRPVIQTLHPSARSSGRRRGGDNDHSDDEDEAPRSMPIRGSASKRASDVSYTLRHRPSEPEPPTSSELRAARVKRRALPYNADEDEDGDEDDDQDDYEDAIDDEQSEGDDPSRTYNREYVGAHPESQWRHCGNGFYKKVSKPSLFEPPALSTRRSSNRSLVKAETTTPAIDESRRYHSTELADYPGEKFRHCGNGWYRRESTSHAPAMQSAIESSDDESTSAEGKYTKQQMIAYKNRYPDAEFVHRGNGRYTLESNFGNFVPDVSRTASTSEGSKQTFSKEYVDAHPGEHFYHAGSGRYRRGSRPTPKQPEIRKKSTGDEELPIGLVDRTYVLQHPKLTFHHRGQGRYALGPRPSETPVAAESEKAASPTMPDGELVDRAYVDAHPNENFHHRGQGRWARGLPSLGASHKTAVRGPGADSWKVQRTPSSSAPPPVVKAEDLPGLDELLVRSEGPDKFPQLDWVYRGGGKWARTPKVKSANVRNTVGIKPVPPRRKRKSRAVHEEEEDEQDDDDGYGYDLASRMQLAGEQEVAEAASQAATESRRQSLDDATTGRVKRRNRASLFPPEPDEASRLTSKHSSQKSKTNTPKPQRLTLEEDRLSDDNNYPRTYAEIWPETPKPEEDDDASQLMRSLYRPVNTADTFINALIRKDPATRPKEVLYATTEHIQQILRDIQDEYLELDKITAPHARIARKPAKGGRLPVDPAIFEDRKEADLYDYNFDARKVGFQDPEAQKIVRDAEGRELRKRRNRSGLDIDPANINGTPFNGDEVGPRRVVKPVSRFDGAAPAPVARRKRTAAGTLKGGSATPDPGNVAAIPPSANLPSGYQPATSGRWAGHIPKRIRQLRGESLGSAPSAASSPAPEDVHMSGAGVEVSRLAVASPTPEGQGEAAEGQAIRKGRPKGSKNLHKRRDAGIPKGPRKPKVVTSIEGDGTLAGSVPVRNGVIRAEDMDAIGQAGSGYGNGMSFG